MQVNSYNNLTYNLAPMTRSLNETDYTYNGDDVSSFSLYYVNVCANTKEDCDPETPVCFESVSASFPFLATFSSWGNVSYTSWSPYRSNTSEDGISLRYSSNVTCGDSQTVESFLNVLCDVDVATGVIDNVEESEDGCTTEVFMRSRYGCGYDPAYPPTCANWTSTEVACSFFGKANFNCQAGDFFVSVTGNQNVPKYTFYMDSNFTAPASNSSAVSNSTESESEDDSDSQSDSYQLFFSQFYETEADGKKTPSSSISLPSLTWEFTEPTIVVFDDEDCSTETTFNITNTDGPRWKSLVFVNHLSMASNTSSLKFDVIIEDYEWSSDSSENLVLSLNYSGSNGSAVVTNSTNAESGDSFLDIAPIAYGYVNMSDPANNQTVTASFTTNGKVEISYSKFEGSLVHDPTMGVAVPVPQPPCSDLSCNFPSMSLETSVETVPTWEFSLSGQSPFTISLDTLMEVTQEFSDLNTVDGSQMDLSDFTWTTTDPHSVVYDNNAYTVYEVQTGSSERWNSFTLRVIISMREGNTHFNIEAMIDDYSWVSEDSSLQLEFGMVGQGNISVTYNTITVGNSYIQSFSQATGSSLAQGTQISTVFLYYENSAKMTISHFTGDLFTYFQMGITDSVPSGYTPTQSDESNDTWIIVLSVSIGIIVLLAIVAGIVGGAFLYKAKKTASYESLD